MIPLTEDIFDSLMIFFERQQINIADCDIFLSVFSGKDTDIIDVPSSVNKMLKHINCKLVFSYTAAGNDCLTRSAPKIGRNDPCHCGSDLKFKKCCGKN